MTLFNTYSNIIIIAALCNFYKVSIFINCYLNKQPYNIFPWSNEKNKILSESNPIWLLIHLLLATSLIILAKVNIMYYRNKLEYNFYRIYYLLHLIFCGFIMCNAWHLADLNPWIALLVNYGVIFLMSYCLDDTEIYFCILSIPVLVQIINVIINFNTFINYFFY